MRILHYLPTHDSMLTNYVNILTQHVGGKVENIIKTNAADAKALLRQQPVSILHLHGCWQQSAYTVCKVARQQGTRIVITPHGQLEPWVIDEHYWKEKLPKLLLYQRRLIALSYAIIVQGSMEHECMTRLGWNQRIVTIRNSQITHSITDDQMAHQVYQVYRQVMDSNPLQLMTDETQDALRTILKVGITGDKRWTGNAAIHIPDEEQWRMLLCYASQEQLLNVFEQGLRVLGLQPPAINLKGMTCFMPKGNVQAESIQQAIGNQYATENERLVATFRQMHLLAQRHQLTISHMVELDRELREHPAEEDLLQDMLKDKHLYRFAGRTLHLMSILTHFDEGMMPVHPINDRKTRQLLKQINNHLKI